MLPNLAAQLKTKSELLECLRAIDSNFDELKVKLTKNQGALVARKFSMDYWLRRGMRAIIAQNRASVYGRAFMAHDFYGDVEGRARALSASSQWRNFFQELASTWGEFGVGATYCVTDSSMLAIDLSKAVGGDIDTDYRFNIAAKYTF